MEILPTPLPGLLLVKPDVFTDHRGYFLESYNAGIFGKAGIEQVFIQDNESLSRHGVIRGLHYQLEPLAQTKLVRVVEGVVFDVAVDLRRGSPTFGKWFGIELSGENKLQLLIPRGFAHGFSVLSETVVFVYKCDQFYNREMERAVRFNDPFLNIDWKIAGTEWSVSEKDRTAPLFRDAEINFHFRG